MTENKQEEQITAEKTEKKKIEKKNSWKAIAVILGIAVIVMLFLFFKGGITGGITGKVISEKAAGEKLISYLNERTGGGVELISTEDIGSIYEVIVSYQGDEIPVYITKDGDYYFISSPVPLNEKLTTSTPQTQDVPKSDKPRVELFVMTHCPYGTQAEKGLIPVLELLGDKILGKIRFVHYFMHEPEEEETPRQVCIREEQPSKWLNYLKCFLEDGDVERCINSVGIDKAKLNSCIASKAGEYYETDSKVSQEYGVGGSPTLIINGVQVSSGRDSASYLSAICSAFNTPPSECSQSLSTASPSPGFGYSVSESSGTGQC